MFPVYWRNAIQVREFLDCNPFFRRGGRNAILFVKWRKERNPFWKTKYLFAFLWLNNLALVPSLFFNLTKSALVKWTCKAMYMKPSWSMLHDLILCLARLSVVTTWLLGFLVNSPPLVIKTLQAPWKERHRNKGRNASLLKFARAEVYCNPFFEKDLERERNTLKKGTSNRLWCF